MDPTPLIMQKADIERRPRRACQAIGDDPGHRNRLWTGDRGALARLVSEGADAEKRYREAVDRLGRTGSAS